MQFGAGTQKGKTKSRSVSSKTEWIIKPPSSESEQLSRSLKISPLLAQVLINRGIIDSSLGHTFLRPKLTELISPDRMPGIQAAVQRIKKAILNKGKITVYGDYDVDGITGVAILWHLLTLLGADADYYIPHRIEEGYGLNTEAISLLAKAGSSLLITVDCGISAIESAELADKLGLDLIITDHHQPDEKLPKAAAIVHPAIDSSYPNPDSSGAMVAFKLAWAIANEFSGQKKLEGNIREFMLNATSLAAIGTIADIVDLRGENRVLASYGLKAIPSCTLPGIAALIETAGLSGQGLDSFHIGFKLAPMLNAAGRMGHARLAVELLTSQSTTRTAQIAEYLKTQNSQRQQCERKILKQACQMILEKGLNHPDRKSIVLASSDWHTGVIGIVASRIVETFHRPTILINIGSEPDRFAQGSGRSIEGFDILAAIRACSKHLIVYGGHKMAAGITIEEKNIEQFAADFEAYAQKNLREDDTLAKLHIDAEVSLSEFRKEVVKELQMLEPFGQGNPPPMFATKAVRLCAPPRKCGVNSDHLQMAITDNTNSIRCIGFSFGKWEKKLLEQEVFHVAYHPQINNYNGSSSVEFVLEDISFDED